MVRFKWVPFVNVSFDEGNRRKGVKRMDVNCPAIIGVGRTRFGEHYEREPEKLVEEAWLRASDSAGIERKDLDAGYFSDYFLQITNKVGIEEGFLSELAELHIPMEKMRSFSSALLNATSAIQSGKYDLVLVGGVEKMTDRLDKIRDDLMLLEDPWSYYAGGTPEANHELMFREYIKKYNISGDSLEKFKVALAYIAVKNHSYAIRNEYAQFHKKITVDSVLRDRAKRGRILGLYDFAPISDGSTALILASPKVAKEYTDEPIYILSSASATDYITFPFREDRTGFLATRMVMEKALKEARIELKDIGILELYDQSTLLEMISLEDLGFLKRGEGWIPIYESYQNLTEYYEIDGRELFVNTNGGLKADGNPLGATGGAQIFELVTQLRGEAKERQINGDLRFGCSLELEGFGTKAYVHILGRC